MGFNFMGDFMFSIIPFFVFGVFILVFGMFIFIAVKGIKTWNYNNAQPVLSVWAKVVSKRTNVSNHVHHHDNVNHHTTSTSYYVTFQVESGDRIEFTLSGDEFGMLVEGDEGKLTFQGTRYKGFTRNRVE